MKRISRFHLSNDLKKSWLKIIFGSKMFSFSITIYRIYKVDLNLKIFTTVRLVHRSVTIYLNYSTILEIKLGELF